MIDRQKLIEELEWYTIGRSRKSGDKYVVTLDIRFVNSILELLKEQNELINELLDLGYPHNFQHEAPWVVDYLYKLTEIIKKAFKANEGR